MSVRRVLSLVFVLLVGAMAACGNTSTSASASLDALTTAEPDSTRQRAMRRLNLASAYFEQDQNDVALQEVRAALRIDPNYADAYSLLGLIHQRNQAPALAQQSFEQAIDLASKPSVALSELAAIQHNFGWFLCEQNQFKPAQVQFDRALAVPNYRQAEKTRKAQQLCMARASGQASKPIQSP